MPAENSYTGPFLGAIPPPLTRPPLALPKREPSHRPPPAAGGLLSFAHAEAPDAVRRRAEELAATRAPFATHSGPIAQAHATVPQIAGTTAPFFGGGAVYGSTSPFAGNAPMIGSSAPFGASPASYDAARRMDWEMALHRRAWELDERERSLLRGQSSLFERERQIAELEAKLAEYESDAAQRSENEALGSRELERKRELLDSMTAALEQREKSLIDARRALADRQAYVEHAESQLLSKLEAVSAHEQALKRREAALVVSTASPEATTPVHAA